MRKAWTSGGVEFNWSPGYIGHSTFTLSNVYAAQLNTSRGPVIRVWESVTPSACLSTTTLPQSRHVMLTSLTLVAHLITHSPQSRTCRYDRIQSTTWQVDILLDGPTLFIHPRVANPNKEDKRGCVEYCHGHVCVRGKGSRRRRTPTYTHTALFCVHVCVCMCVHVCVNL